MTASSCTLEMQGVMEPDLLCLCEGGVTSWTNPGTDRQTDSVAVFPVQEYPKRTNTKHNGADACFQLTDDDLEVRPKQSLPDHLVSRDPLLCNCECVELLDLFGVVKQQVWSRGRPAHLLFSLCLDGLPTGV